MAHIKINPELCVGCGQCSLVCDVEAIHMQWGEVKLDGDLCVMCGACIEYCPAEALVLEEGENS